MVRIAGCEGVTIVEEDDARSYVFADRVQVQQVIVNLIKNACEACTGDGAEQVVTVSTQVTDDVVTLSVADTGSGVAGSAADKLFDWSDSSKPGGTGIGLAISRTIIENQSGKIWLEDTSLDGSRFCFSLPIAPLAA
jgi:two-component system sensor kinase FixL